MHQWVCLFMYNLLMLIYKCFLIVCILIYILYIVFLMLGSLILPYMRYYWVAYQIRITCICLMSHNVYNLSIILYISCLLIDMLVCIYNMLLGCQTVHNFILMVWYNFLMLFVHIHQNMQDNYSYHINNIHQDMRM